MAKLLCLLSKIKEEAGIFTTTTLISSLPGMSPNLFLLSDLS